MNKDLVAASARPLILSLLSKGESYGYEIIQQVRELSGGEIEWTDGMLYPVLHRLERQQLIESDWRHSESGRKRKYYRLRQTGQHALASERKQWMTVHTTLVKLWDPELA
jgi:DNA-binding PadR family transcriptional regulator